jgi:hypothetical protein
MTKVQLIWFELYAVLWERECRSLSTAYGFSGSFKGVGEKKPGSKGFTYNSILNKLRRYF